MPNTAEKIAVYKSMTSSIVNIRKKIETLEKTNWILCTFFFQKLLFAHKHTGTLSEKRS